jgi:hypothetical protein
MPYDNDISTLTYISHAYDELTPEDIADILEKSVNNNKLWNITGILLYNNKRFFQLLEGYKIDIENIFDKIALDARHHNITILNKSKSKMRLLGNWSMAFLSDHSEYNISCSDLNVFEKMNLEKFIINIEDIDPMSRIFLKNIFQL